ncbi:MAG: hypothetical protein OEZ58_09155, partial [Gammaproteobacteria bacterium]|nr:hypothetical protein [Gammaproteobacteria bacterium]
MLKQILFLVTIVLVLLAGCASEKQSSTDVAPTDKANILPDPSTKMDDRTWRLAQGDINWLLFKETPDQTWQLITPVLHGNNEARYLLPGTAQRYILAYGREAPLFSLPHDLIHIDYIGPSANREPTQLEKFQNDFLHDLHAIHTIRGQLISDVETGLRWLSIAGQELRPYDYDDYEIKVAPGLHDIIAFESAKDNPRFFIKRNVNIQQDEIHNIDFTDAEFVFSAQVFSINNNCNSLGDGLKSIYGRFQSEY